MNERYDRVDDDGFDETTDAVQRDGSGVAERAKESVCTDRRTVLRGVAAAGLTSVGLTTIGSASVGAESTSIGGPVILMGLDSEWDASDRTHGPRDEHAAMAQALLDDVTNGGEGILVVGSAGSTRDYWDNLGDDVGETVTYANGVDDINVVDFDGYAMIGIASSERQVTGGLSDEENEAIIDRASDIAGFVNDGGALLGKSQDGLTNPFGYVDPLGDFEIRTGINYSAVDVTDDGLDLGLTQDGMSGWCCWHDTLIDYPEFFDVLVTNDDSTSDGYGEAAAIGGGKVIIVIDVEAFLAGPAETTVGEDTDYDLQIQNVGDETPEAVTTTVSVVRSGGIESGDVDLSYYDAADEALQSISLVEDGNSLSGTIDAVVGDPLSEGFDETVPLRASFAVDDEYTIESNVVGIGDEEDHYASAAIDVDVVPPPFEEECVDLIGGQHNDVGDICVFNDLETFDVTYACDDDWMLTETHLAIGDDLDEFIEEGWINRQHNPRPGHFPFSDDHGDTDEYTYSSTLEDLDLTAGDSIVIAAHAAVKRNTSRRGGSESAWSDGDRFTERGNWAMYFEYEVQ